MLELSSDEDEQMPDGDEIDDDNEPGMTGECDQSSDDDIYENKDVETNAKSHKKILMNNFNKKINFELFRTMLKQPIKIE